MEWEFCLKLICTSIKENMPVEGKPQYAKYQVSFCSEADALPYGDVYINFGSNHRFQVGKVYDFSMMKAREVIDTEVV